MPDDTKGLRRSNVSEDDDKDVPIVLMGPRAQGTQDDDDAIMARIAARDALAFRGLVDAHGPRAHRIAYRMLGNPTEAEDIAQDALMRLWSHADRWRAGGPGIAAWLTRVTVNLCLDRLRRQKFVSDEAVPDRADPATLADVAVAQDQQRALVRSVLAGLPERQRAAIILTYYEDYPNAMAADALDMKLKAFESLLLRARAALRKGLSAKGISTVAALT